MGVDRGQGTVITDKATDHQVEGETSIGDTIKVCVWFGCPSSSSSFIFFSSLSFGVKRGVDPLFSPTLSKQCSEVADLSSLLLVTDKRAGPGPRDRGYDRGYGGGFGGRGRDYDRGYDRGGRDYDRGGRDYDRGGRDYDRGGRDFDGGRGPPPQRGPPPLRGPPPSRARESPNTPATVFAAWEPSQRVKELNKEQVAEIRGRLNLTVEDGDTKQTLPSCPPPIESFEDMNLTRDVMLDIRHHEYLKPTPIQSQAIPIALSGRDILGCAETGSGKTASFSIPMISHCKNQESLKRGDGPLAVVLAPTRELAQQIADECKIFSRTSKINTCIIVGGAPIQEQRSMLRQGVEVVVATPGRFLDHLQQRNTNLDRVSYIVLDEADRMLDMGFEPQIREILTNLPEKHQTLLFSATMPEEIEGLACEYLKVPVRVKVGAVSRPTANVVQHLQKTTEQDKLEALLNLVSQEKEMAERVGGPSARLPMTVVFVETKARCDEVKETLNVNNFSAVALHGGIEQRGREAALLQFRKGHAQILVATDIASRGLDVSGIAHVINMDLPRQFEDYVHRIGRTGRAGASGRATSFYTDRDSYVIAQVKHAISQLEKGNDLVFATGKAARAREREERTSKEEASADPWGEEGCADDAWDD